MTSTEYTYTTAAGALRVTVADNKITRATFGDTQGLASLGACSPEPYAQVGTEFQIAVWQAALAIPVGKVVTYQDIAKAIGRPKAHRAVANALGANKIAYFIPCHRVIRTDGTIGGYYWGIDKKIALLRAEGYAL